MGEDNDKVDSVEVENGTKKEVPGRESVPQNKRSVVTASEGGDDRVDVDSTDSKRQRRISESPPTDTLKESSTKASDPSAPSAMSDLNQRSLLAMSYELLIANEQRKQLALLAEISALNQRNLELVARNEVLEKKQSEVDFSDQLKQEEIDELIDDNDALAEENDLLKDKVKSLEKKKKELQKEIDYLHCQLANQQRLTFAAGAAIGAAVMRFY
jgi:chromosome segregation ATPase